MTIIKSIQAQLDDSKHVAGVFDDLKKTFDTFDHNMLIKKQDHNGVRGVAASCLHEGEETLCSYCIVKIVNIKN